MPVVRNTPPVSNRERQRQFRARNPHYYRDLHRKRKAQTAAVGQLMAQHPELTPGQALAIAQGKAPAPRKAEAPAPGISVATQTEAPATPAPETPETPAVPGAPVTLLALPAPEDVANPTVTITLPDAFIYEPAKIRIVTEPQAQVGRASCPPSGRRPV